MVLKCLSVPPIGTNCYLFGDEASGLCAVVDPGGNAAGILELAASLGLRPDAILLTHGHFDHTGAVEALRAALPGVPVYLHSADRAVQGDQLMPSCGATLDYGEGDRIRVGGVEVEVLHTPGHTPGGVTLRADNILFTGDTLFKGSMGRTDLPGGSYEKLMASLRRLGSLPGNYRVCPGHEGMSTLDAERIDNYYLREALDNA